MGGGGIDPLLDVRAEHRESCFCLAGSQSTLRSSSCGQLHALQIEGLLYGESKRVDVLN